MYHFDKQVSKSSTSDAEQIEQLKCMLLYFIKHTIQCNPLGDATCCDQLLFAHVTTCVMLEHH